MSRGHQLNIFGRTKEEESILFLQKYEPPEGYFLGFSGGKDSVVIKHLAEKAGVKFTPYYSATGIDPPELMQFIRDYHQDVIWKRPALNFWALIMKKGFPPTIWRRYCCDDLKKKPTLKIALKRRIMGIRSEESSRRANRPNPSYIKAHKYWMDKPIFDWQEWEVWDYIERNELSYCSLYDEGFSRIGCVICPFLCGKNTKRVMKHKERWPKHYAMFEKVMHRLFKQHKERLREKSAEELIQNWYRGN